MATLNGEKHKIRFEIGRTSGDSKVFLDGAPLRGVISASFDIDASSLPLVTLRLVGDLDVETLDGAECKLNVSAGDSVKK